MINPTMDKNWQRKLETQELKYTEGNRLTRNRWKQLGDNKGHITQTKSLKQDKTTMKKKCLSPQAILPNALQQLYRNWNYSTSFILYQVFNCTIGIRSIVSLSQLPEKVSMSMLLFWKLAYVFYSHTHNVSPFHGPAQAHGYQKKTHFLPHSCTHSKNNQRTFNRTTPAVLVT